MQMERLVRAASQNHTLHHQKPAVGVHLSLLHQPQVIDRLHTYNLSSSNNSLSVYPLLMTFPS